jgi:hypothetical protein
MTLEEYVAQKEALLASLIDVLVRLLLLLLTPGMSRDQWRMLLRSVYPTIKDHRDRGTELARQFYDSHRAEHLPDEPRKNVFKQDHYPIEWFEQDLEPIRERITDRSTQDAGIEEFVAHAVKTVETGARRTILRAVDSDREVQGWARFDPKPPTCAFCTMMISRGPVYGSAATGGGPRDSKTMEKLWDEDNTAAMNEMMNRWHPACTCIVIPVYDDNYESKAQEAAALEIYKAAVKIAKSGDFKKILLAMREVARDRKVAEQNQLPTAA